MNPPIQPWLTVTEPEAAAFVAHPGRALYLYPFIGRERTAASVAKEYNLPLKSVLYQISRMMALGLLRVTRLEPRKGRPLKHYRAVADAFFVPFEATRLGSLETLVDEWSRSLQPVFLKGFVRALQETSDGWGVRIGREADGRLLITPATRPEAYFDAFDLNAPAVLEGWFTDLRLNPDDAKAFQRELGALYLRYLGRGGEQRYIIRVALAPMDENEIPPSW